MGDKQKAQYQCMNCGTIHWMEDPPDIDENELYTKMKCRHCKQMANHLWVGNKPEDLYLYYDMNADPRYY